MSNNSPEAKKAQEFASKIPGSRVVWDGNGWGHSGWVVYYDANKAPKQGDPGSIDDILPDKPTSQAQRQRVDGRLAIQYA